MAVYVATARLVNTLSAVLANNFFGFDLIV
jgi:hypothetical protein